MKKLLADINQYHKLCTASLNNPETIPEALFNNAYAVATALRKDFFNAGQALDNQSQAVVVFNNADNRLFQSIVGFKAKRTLDSLKNVIIACNTVKRMCPHIMKQIDSDVSIGALVAVYNRVPKNNVDPSLIS